MAETADITLLLDAAREGDRGALDRVLATLYQELHTMARRQLAGQHGHTLDATALVHEAYLKLIGRNTAQFDDRAHFFAYAASAACSGRPRTKPTNCSRAWARNRCRTTSTATTSSRSAVAAAHR